jgi:hypothetical protein
MLYPSSPAYDLFASNSQSSVSVTHSPTQLEPVTLPVHVSDDEKPNSPTRFVLPSWSIVPVDVQTAGVLSSRWINVISQSFWVTSATKEDVELPCVLVQFTPNRQFPEISGQSELLWSDAVSSSRSSVGATSSVTTSSAFPFSSPQAKRSKHAVKEKAAMNLFFIVFLLQWF